MNSIEFTKIAAAVLCALLLIAAPRAFLEIAEEGGPGKTAGYALPEPEPAADAAPAEGKAAGFSFASVAGLLPAANAESGAEIFKKCGACHSADKGGASKVGPALWGVVGRPVAGIEGFAYSDALKGKGGNWDYEQLAPFIHNPKAYASGTKMNFAGIADNAQLADLLAYLQSLSDGPVPFPEVPAAQPAEAAAQAPAGPKPPASPQPASPAAAQAPENSKGPPKEAAAPPPDATKAAPKQDAKKAPAPPTLPKAAATGAGEAAKAAPKAPASEAKDEAPPPPAPEPPQGAASSEDGDAKAAPAP